MTSVISRQPNTVLMNSATLLRAGPNKLLSKMWLSDGRITPAANATWFQGKEGTVASVADICLVLDVIEKWPRVALVKEASAPGVDVNRLRRKCSAGVDEHAGEPFPVGLSWFRAPGLFSTSRSFSARHPLISTMALALRLTRAAGSPMSSSPRPAFGN
jgi:hypothetical protein